MAALRLRRLKTAIKFQLTNKVNLQLVKQAPYQGIASVLKCLPSGRSHRESFGQILHCARVPGENARVTLPLPLLCA